MVTQLACTDADLSIVGSAGNNDHRDEQFRRRLYSVIGGLELARNQRETDFIASCMVNR